MVQKKSLLELEQYLIIRYLKSEQLIILQIMFKKKPKSGSVERDYYDHDEILHALECLDKMPAHKNGVSDKLLHFQNLRFKTAITTLFNSGLRREELFGLKWMI